MSDIIEKEDASFTEDKSENHAESLKPDNIQDEIQLSEGSKSHIGLWLVVIIVLVALGFAFPVILSRFPIISDSTTISDEVANIDEVIARLNDLEARTKTAEEKLEKLSIGTIPVSGNSTVVQTTGGNPDEVEKLKSGLAGLSGALTMLQNELEKSSKQTNEERVNTQAGLASIIAFIQMQRVALGGGPFEKERQTLRRLADNDQALVDILVRLEKNALTGVPTIDTLSKEWRSKLVEAQAALRKAGAQTWMDRIVVALEGLISIRSLNPKASDSMSFAAITMDLDEGKLVSAFEKVISLPTEVQDSIKEWRVKAQSRLDVETLLNEISTHLIERGSPLPPMAPDSVQPLTEGAQ